MNKREYGSAVVGDGHEYDNMKNEQEEGVDVGVVTAKRMMMTGGSREGGGPQEFVSGKRSMTAAGGFHLGGGGGDVQPGTIPLAPAPVPIEIPMFDPFSDDEEDIIETEKVLKDVPSAVPSNSFVIDTYTTCPIFTPTVEEFRNLNQYLLSVAKQASSIGLCKIIPPKEWTWSMKMEDLDGIIVKSPIQQCIMGRSGIYSVANVQRTNMKYATYKSLADKQEQKTLRRRAGQQPYSKETFDPALMEREFWKNLTTTADAPVYGSDVPGSLSNKQGVPFTMDDLDCSLKKLGVVLDGITKPMLYIGMWRSMFAFHTEDMNLFSINIVHAGAPKMWYGIPPAAGPRLETLAQSYWPDEHRVCDQFLRHKTKMISPQRLKENAIPFVRAVQHPGEIMVTWPGSYHGGFNAGQNVAEAVNFVPPSLARWYIHKWGRKAKICKCQPDSVMINMRWFNHHVRRLRKEQKEEEESMNLNTNSSDTEVNATSTTTSSSNDYNNIDAISTETNHGEIPIVSS